MEEEKIPKKKSDTSFNRWLSVAKKLREHGNGQVKMLKNLFYRGNMIKGKYGKVYYDILLEKVVIKYTSQGNLSNFFK